MKPSGPARMPSRTWNVSPPRKRTRYRTSSDRGQLLAADTVVVVEGQILGKPSEAAAAARMLELLSGKIHAVLTGVCLVVPLDGPIGIATARRGGRATVTRVASTTVEFAQLDRSRRSTGTWRAASRWTRQAHMPFRGWRPGSSRASTALIRMSSGCLWPSSIACAGKREY